MMNKQTYLLMRNDCYIMRNNFYNRHILKQKLYRKLAVLNG